MAGQPGFFDVEDRLKQLSAKGDSLERLNAVVDFALFRRAARMARRRGDQPIEQTRGFDLVAPPECLDDALDMATALARVLDQVEVLIGSNLLDQLMMFAGGGSEMA
jgi:hypothetical protein